jgi:putative sterol carrier protein
MAEQQPPLPDDVTPEQFFEQLLPMGFAAQASAGGATPAEFSIQFRLTGEGGGDWHAAIGNGAMAVRRGSAEANFTVSLGVADWRDAVLGRNGATIGLIIPQNRPGRPDNSARAKALKGTMALELSRPEADPFRVEMSFNNAAAPRTLLRMTLVEYLGMQDGSQNGQQLFMQGRIKVEGDMAFLMQVASLNM